MISIENSVKKVMSMPYNNVILSNRCVWMRRIIEWIKEIPQNMKKNFVVAASILLLSNAIFFTGIHMLANALERRLHHNPSTLSSSEKQFNFILIDCIFVGGSVLNFNFLLSKLTQYPLSKIHLTAITVVAILLRSLISYTKNSN